MTNLVERLRDTGSYERDLLDEAANEIEQLQTDKAAISQTASDYLHEIERLQTALKQAKE